MAEKLPSSNLIVLVTGCSSGIGKAICDLMGASGARVYGGSRSRCTPSAWTYVRMDVTDEDSVRTAVQEVMGREGRINALVSCAGVSLAGPIEETTIDEAKWQFETNFYGTVRLLRAVLPIMRAQASGKIIVIGSIGGLIGLPHLGYYSASKFALDGLVEALRAEVAPFGIDANILHPGSHHTAMAANEVFSGATSERSPYYAAFRQTRDQRNAIESKAPSPDVVARKVRSLLSQRALPVRALVGAPMEKAGVYAKSALPSGLFEKMFRLSHSASGGQVKKTGNA